MRKHFKYLWYVLRHKWFVFLYCLQYGLIWRGIVHDLSKFRLSEWSPYVNFFHGDKRPAKSDIGYKHEVDSTQVAFNIAWNHHQKRNDHHWQYWLLQYDDGRVEPLPMPDVCRKEMLADWRGAGRAQGKPDTALWYVRNRDNMVLHPETRNWVEKALRVDFTEEELETADIASTVENWSVDSIHEAALHIRRSKKQRLVMSLGITVNDWEL